MDMKEFERVVPHLAADPYAKVVMQDMVGKCLRYDVPATGKKRVDFLRTHGTVVLTTTWIIIGVQKDYKGDLCYRIQDVNAPLSFGRALGTDVPVIFVK